MRILFLVLFAFVVSSCAKIDDSMKLFFPKEVKNLQSAQTEFPAFWWNFIVIEPKNQKADFQKAESICNQLKKEISKSLRMIICGENIASALPLLIQWGQDSIYREKFNVEKKSDYLRKMNETLVQVSYLNQKDLLPLFRVDPFQTWQTYLQLNQRPEFSKLVRSNGFMLSAETQNIIIPVQFSLRPQMSTAENVMTIVKSDPRVHMIGAHASSYLNEKQVRDDMQIVSVIGGGIFIVFLFFLFLKSKWVATLVFIPTVVSVWLASVVTSWVYGSVHGLTLAFGSGIAGLAMDYGLHGAFGSDQKQTWKSNLIGLITTLCGVGILTFSGIPLIRQMMFFSMVGLGFGFMIFYLISKHMSEIFKMESLPVKFPVWRHSIFLLILVVIVGFFGATKLQMNMDLRKLSFMSKQDEDIAKQIFTNGGDEKETILLVKSAQSNLLEEQEMKTWSELNKIHFEGISNYLPSMETQKENYQSWQKEGCYFLNNGLSTQQKTFFKPFINTNCDVKSESNLFDRLYVNHLVFEDKTLSIFSTESKNQTKLVQDKFPEATSLGQSLKDFSNSLSKDLTWMIPVAVFLTLIVLSIYYKDAMNVFTAVLPFLIGLAVYFMAALFLQLDINLISVLGLVMVFGFSVDYGVFSTDVHKHNGDYKEQKSVYSALTFAAITNSLGFFPMLFAKHPVLHNLGCALFYGTLGTYIGTIWGVYVLYSKKNERKTFWYF